MHTTPETQKSETQNNAEVANANPRRSLVMLGLGALCGLLLAGYGLFTASGSSSNTVPEGTLALVNQKQILVSDFNAQFMAEFGKAPAEGSALERQKTLNDMVREELLVQRGLEMDLVATDPDVRAALVEGVNVVNDAEQAAQTVSEETMREYYKQHQDKYLDFGSMALRKFSLPANTNDKLVAQLITQIKTGAKIDLKKFAVAQTDFAEEIDPAIKTKLGDALFAVAATLTSGAVSAAISDKNGIHVLQMMKRKPPMPTPFETVRNIIPRDIKAEALKKTSDQQLANLRNKAEIIVAPGFQK